MENGVFFMEKSMNCDHSFIQKYPGVEKLLDFLDQEQEEEQIEKATEILAGCPECSLAFFQELLVLLKNFVMPRNPKAVLPWAMTMLGYSYSEIQKILQIEKPETMRVQIFRTRQFLLKVSERFQIKISS